MIFLKPSKVGSVLAFSSWRFLVILFRLDTLLTAILLGKMGIVGRNSDLFKLILDLLKYFTIHHFYF